MIDLNVNFSILVYFHIPLIIDLATNLLISSKLTTKVYIQNTIHKEIERPIDNIKREINLFSELDCCQSCTNLIFEFREKFPNIKVNIITNNTLK